MADLEFPIVPVVLCAGALYLISIVLYRLFWHPLAAFPGPLLGRVANLYIPYLDLWLDGSFATHMPGLHEKYGPVVRIGVNELHVFDRKNYGEVFKVGTEYSKDKNFYSPGSAQGSLLCILDTPSARTRKDAYNHYWSRPAIATAEPLALRKIRQFVEQLGATAGKKTIDLSDAFRCLTADIIIQYAYDEDFGGLASENFKHPVIEAVDDMFVELLWATHFPRVSAGLEAAISVMPSSLLHFLSYKLYIVKNFEKDCASSILRLKKDIGTSRRTTPTMFDRLLQPEKNKGRPVPPDAHLAAEAMLVLVAGMDTTANALTLGTWAVLNDPEIYQKLKAELKQAIPDEQAPVKSEDLKKLSYLNGVCKESLRLTFGAPGRLPRVRPHPGTIAGKFVPAGVIISHSHYLYHMDEHIWPDAQRFWPDRWLVDDTTVLENNLLSFSKGSRACLGMHLANVDLLLTFAMTFRFLKLDMVDTTPKDMDWRDLGLIQFRGHLKARVQQEDK